MHEADFSRTVQRDPVAVTQRVSPGRGVALIAALFGLQVADGIDQVALSFTAPAIQKGVGLGFDALGAAFTAGYIGTALGAVAFGAVADAIGRKRALCIATLSFAMGSLVTVAVTNGPQLMVVRLLTGLALGGLLPIITAITLKAFTTRLRATILTVVLVGTPLGSALCGPIAFLVEPRFGWRGVFVIGGILPVVMLLLAILFVPHEERPLAAVPADKEGPTGWVADAFGGMSAIFTGAHSRVTLMLWLAAVASAVPMFFALSWLPSLAHQAHISRADASFGPAIFSLSGLVSAILLARAVDWLGITALIVTTALGSVAFVLLGLSFTSDVAFLAACGLAGGLSISSSNVMGWVAGTLYEDRLRAGGTGWMVAIMRLGAAATPGVTGILIARAFPIFTMFLAMAVFPLISAYALFRLREHVLAR